jgi:hypothetical protein
MMELFSENSEGDRSRNKVRRILYFLRHGARWNLSIYFGLGNEKGRDFFFLKEGCVLSDRW